VKTEIVIRFRRAQDVETKHRATRLDRMT